MGVNAAGSERERRWNAEAAFFDDLARSRLADVAPLSREILARYSGPRRLHNLEEFRVWLLGDLTGRRVLDAGCGDGAHSVLFAALGAIVTGVDISAEELAIARRRAEVSGVADRCEFQCAPLETADLAPEAFDVVWGEAILHHLLGELDALLPRLYAALRPGGLVVFSEPISLDTRLRRLRFWVPVACRATPDERPLEASDIGVLRKHLPDLRVMPFRLLGRLGRLVLPDSQYERAASWRRRAVDALALTDRVLFSMPAFRTKASVAVFWSVKSAGHPMPRLVGELT